MDQTERSRPRARLVVIASRVLRDHDEAQDIVQQAWRRLHRTDAVTETEIANLPAWLTTVTTRLCLALHVVLERLTPRKRQW